MNVSERIDKMLLEHREPYKPAGGMPFRASTIGYPACVVMRDAYGEPHTRPMSAQTLAIFEAGHALANKYRRWFEKMGELVPPPEGMGYEWSVVSDDYLCGAHLDFLIDEREDGLTLVELKSMATGGIKYATDKHLPIAKPHQLMQAACGLICAAGLEVEGKPVRYAMVLTENKNDQLRYVEYVTPQIVEETAARMREYVSLYRSGLMPDCSCQGFWKGGRYVEYCEFGFGVGADRGGTCCGR